MSLHDFNGRVALVTGGGSGIGRATCFQLAKSGARVVVTDISLMAAQRTLRLMPGSGRHLALQMDVTQLPAVEGVIAAAREQLGEPPSLLVNSAGITGGAACHIMDEEAFDSVIDVNLKGTFLVSQAFTRALLEEPSIGNCRGTIVNVSSIEGKAGPPGHCHYTASKGGVNTLTKTCAAELAKKGVRVNAVLPGAINTPLNARLTPEDRKSVNAKIPLGRFGRAQEVAEVVVFLLSWRSSYMTGACVEVTGGLWM